eukprot:EG_transcript_4809
MPAWGDSLRWVVALWLVGARDAAPAGSPGSPRCPCMDPQLNALQEATLGHSTNCLFASESTTKALYCYPKDYGTGQCHAWNSGLPPFCNATLNPDFCGDAWCFVAPNCSLSFKRSDLFAQPSYVSYETCGSADRQAAFLVENAFRGRTLRLGFPSFERPYLYADPSGRVANANGTAVTGAMVQLLLDVLTAAGLGYSAGPISPISLALFPLSSYTACVHTVGMGLLDLCVGAFMETSQRHSLSPIGNMVFADYMVLLTQPVTQTDGFWDLVVKIFRPFTWQLWLVCAVVTLGFGLLIWYNERSERMEVGHAVYISLSIFCPNADGYQPSPGGRLLLLTMGTFVTLILATYTATLASFLVVETTTVAEIADLPALTKAGKTLCLLQALQQQVLLLEPRLAGYVRLYPNTVAVVAGLMAGECNAAFMTQTHAMRATTGQFGGCGLVASTVPLLTLSNALPMDDVLTPTLGYWQQRVLEQKPWSEYMTQFQETPKCDAVGAADAQAQPVGLSEMLGLWLVIAVLLVLWVVKRCTLRHAAKSLRRVRGHKRRRAAEVAAEATISCPTEPSSFSLSSPTPLCNGSSFSRSDCELSPDLLVGPVPPQQRHSVPPASFPSLRNVKPRYSDVVV